MSTHSTPLVVSPCEPGQFTLPIPADVVAALTPAQSKKVTAVQLKFAQDVAALISHALAKVSDIVGTDLTEAR